MSDLTTAVEVLLAKRTAYDEAEAYYEGTVTEVLPRRFRRLFVNSVGDYKINFARTVVDSVLNRLELASIVATTQAAQAKVNQVFEQDDFHLEADEIHRRALEYGDCYAIVWPDDEGELQINYNSPTTTTLVYDVENPRKKAYAAKMWKPDEKTVRLNLYYPDRIVKFSKQGTVMSGETEAGWTQIDTLDNPWGEVPVFHFRTARPYGRPEHADAFDLQDAINKTIVTHMYTMDYQGAPQRYALSATADSPEIADFADDDTARENINGLQNGPGELWYLKGVQSVGQFNPADPDVFLKPIREYVRAMASTTNTPLHYFEATGNVPSGEALRTAEAPLLKKVGDRQQAFGSAWRDLFRFILRVEGVKADVQVKWMAVESLDSLATWDVMLKKINAGLSHRQALREGGYDEQIIDKIMEERAAEAAAGLYYQRAPQTRVRESNELGQTEDN